MQDTFILYTPEADTHAHALSEALNDTPVLSPVQGEQALRDSLDSLRPGARVYLFIPDGLMPAALDTARSLTLLPMPWEQNPHTRTGLLLADDWQTQLKDWTQEWPQPLSALPQANGHWVLNRISIGTALQAPGTRPWHKLRWTLNTLRGARLRPFTLTTAKGQTVKLSAFNIQTGLSGALWKRFNRLCPGDQPTADKLSALIFAPQSIMQFLQLSLKRWLPQQQNRLPPGVGLVRSEALLIESEHPFPLRIDSDRRMTERLEARLVPLSCQLTPGRPMVPDGHERETLRLDQVPTGEEAVDFFQHRPLPLFPHAPEAAFAELFSQIRQSARFTPTFGVLLVLSVLLATVGLFQNASPVIIGAMILAPLMAPIISLSMGLIRLDTRLIRQSALTVTVGTLLAVGLAALFSALMPFGHLTDQMASRTHPTLLDLSVAILSGLAAAYAYSREEVAKSLAGVAIAVALVPPLAVAGIGLGWGDWSMFKGAFLLFLANLVGIIVAAGTLFYILGFSALKTARVAFVWKLAMLAAIIAPLTFSTATLIEEERLWTRLNALKTIGYRQHRLPVQITDVRITDGRPQVSVRVAVPAEADAQARARLVDFLRGQLGGDVDLLIEYRVFYPAEDGQ